MKRAVIFILSIFPLFVQSEPPQTFRDRLRTSDALFWKNEVYHIDRSPLERFHGFDTLFSDYPGKGGFSIPGFPLPKGYFAIDDPPRCNKPYSVIWKISGDTLYANEIYFYQGASPREDALRIFPHNQQYRALERLTGRKFTETNPAVKVEPEAPHGVMPALWISGDYFIKEPYTYDKKWDTPVWRLTFDKGKLIGVRKETFR